MRDIGNLVAELDYVETGVKVETLAAHYQPIQFACPVCGEIYDTQLAAEVCRDTPYDNGGLKIGDIVAVPGAFNNDYPLDDPWLAFEIPPDPTSRSHFARDGYRVPYYVVTSIYGERQNKHRCIVTLATLCGGYLGVGWNPANGDGHYSMFRIDGGKHCDAGSTWIESIRDLLVTCDPSASMRKEAAGLATIGISTRHLL